VCDVYSKAIWAKVCAWVRKRSGDIHVCPCAWCGALCGNTVINVALGLWLVGHRCSKLTLTFQIRMSSYDLISISASNMLRWHNAVFHKLIISKATCTKIHQHKEDKRPFPKYRETVGIHTTLILSSCPCSETWAQDISHAFLRGCKVRATNDWPTNLF